MSKKNKKQLREKAIAAELARREAARKNRSPLDRDQMLELVTFVAHAIALHGVNRDFGHTKKWLVQKDIPVDACIAFLESERIQEDWDVVVKGDPYKLFGSTETRLAWMPLERPDLEELIDWLDQKVSELGCDNSHKLTESWLEKRGFDPPPILMALLAQGGGCDCEVALNVEPNGIYP